MRLHIGLDYMNGPRRHTSIQRLDDEGKSIMSVTLEGDEITQLATIATLKHGAGRFVELARALRNQTPEPATV